MPPPSSTLGGIRKSYLLVRGKWGEGQGNRTDQNVTSGTCNAFHATVNTQNQLSGSPYQYDAAGNMTNDGNHTYFYDAENRLAQVDGTLGTCSTATACYQ